MKRYGSPSGGEHSASKRNIRGGDHPADEAEEAEAEGVEAEEVFTLMLADRGVPSPDIQEIVKVDPRERVRKADLDGFVQEFDPDLFVEILMFSSRDVDAHGLWKKERWVLESAFKGKLVGRHCISTMRLRKLWWVGKEIEVSVVKIVQGRNELVYTAEERTQVATALLRELQTSACPKVIIGDIGMTMFNWMAACFQHDREKWQDIKLVMSSDQNLVCMTNCWNTILRIDADNPDRILIVELRPSWNQSGGAARTKSPCGDAVAPCEGACSMPTASSGCKGSRKRRIRWVRAQKLSVLY